MADIKLLNSLTKQFYGDFNDIDFTNSDITLVSGHDQAKQSTVKLLLTQRGHNLIFPGYGADLQSFVNARLTDPAINTKIKNTVLNSLAYLATVQDSTDPSERIATIDNLTVQFIQGTGGSGSGFLIVLTVILEDGSQIFINLGV